jgi:charged multivesicular body protein 5
MSDMLEDADEINEIMGRAYGVPEELDENDLMDELGALEDEIAQEESEELPGQRTTPHATPTAHEHEHAHCSTRALTVR